MKSTCSFKIEADGVQSPTDTPSIAVSTYDHRITNISNEHSTVIDLLITDTKLFSHTLQKRFVRSDNDLNLTQQLLVLTSQFDGNLRSLIQVYFSFDDFSQSTACNATRFGECSSTLLNRLWYLYSYIYKRTTTICYGIYIFLNSQHTSPFRLLPCVKHTTTPSALIPLFTTSSSTTHCILQVSVLLESASTPPLSITSSTFLVNFIKSTIFLILAGVVNTNNGPDSNFYFTIATTQFGLLAVFRSPTPSLPHTTRSFVVIFFISPVGAVDRDFDFHLIDQGKVGYLYHLQILLFNLQDSSLSNNVSSSSYSLWLNLYLNNNNDADNDKATPAVMIKAFAMTYDNTVFNSIAFIASDEGVNNDDESSAIITKNTTSSEPHSTVRDKIFATESSVVVTMKPFASVVTVTMKPTTSSTLFYYYIDSARSSSSSYDNTYTDGVDGISFTAVSVADKVMFSGSNAPVTVTRTTQVYSKSSSMPFESSNNHVTLFSAVAEADTITSYTSLSSNNNNGCVGDNNSSFGSNDEYILINAPLHIIDHVSVVYLILLQIPFYDQQDSL